MSALFAPQRLGEREDASESSLLQASQPHFFKPFWDVVFTGVLRAEQRDVCFKSATFNQKSSVHSPLL